jgi:integrase/recombinase XerD
MSRTRTASIDQRGDSFRVRISVGGTRHTFTVATKSRRAAERFALEKLRELERGHERAALGLPTAPPVSELLRLVEAEEFPALARGTREAYADSLKPIRSYFVERLKDPRVDQIAAKHVSGYLTWRRTHRLQGDEPLSNRTLQKDRAVLHRIFAFADRLELRDGNPVAWVRPPKADGRDPIILSADEYDRLVAACDVDDDGRPADRPMLRLYVLVLGEAGLRCDSEALRLRWEDVDLEEGFLWVASGRADAGGERHRTKSGKGRWVPITPRLATALKDHFAAFRFGGSPWVFHHERARRQAKAGDRIGSLRHAFVKAATRAKLPPALHQHDLRHRRVTSWLAEGRDVVHVKEAMGHSDLRTTMGYTHLAREHLRSLTAPATEDSARTKRRS